jgi:hypothetical protein
MKKRTSQTRTGNRGITAIMRYCDEYDLIFLAEPREDYGIDCYIELEADTHPQNFIIGIQSKSGPSHKHDVKDTGFSIYVSKNDIEYWIAANYPVFFVYYDVESDQLYFKHVQDQLQHYTDISDCKKFLFTESDSASNGALASYALQLLEVTPNLLNRLEIAKAEHPILKIGEKLFPIVPSKNHSGLANIEPYISGLLGDSARSYPRYSTVIGHSTDARWILTLDVEDLGSVGASNVTATFLDTLDWAKLPVSLFDYLEWYKAENELREVLYDKEMETRAGKVQSIIQQLNIVQARRIYRDPITYTSRDDNRPSFTLCYGKEDFDIELNKYNGRDAIVLTNHSYSPARSIPILSERLTPVGLIDSITNGSLDIYGFDQVRRFEYIYEVVLSYDANWITLSVMTNTDHDCLGCPLMHLVHLRVDELREFCLQALFI